MSEPYSPPGFRCGGVITGEVAAELLAQAKAAKEARATEMPTDADALATLNRAHQRLKELGWRDATYCPKDGTIFHAIEAGSSGIHDCYYSGEWPKGSWWIEADGDAWPSRPILFRLYGESE